MESRLDEVREELEHLEEAPEGRFKLVVTCLVLLVTMTTTVGAFLAADAASRESTDQRQRQVLSARAVTDHLQAAASSRALRQLGWADDEATLRANYLTELDLAPGLPAADRQELRIEAAGSAVAAAAVRRTTPSDLPVVLGRLQAAGDLDQQTAAARASQSSQWLGKEDAALSTVSMLALALFLLGLALTIAHRATAQGFTGLAAALLAVAVVRLVMVAGTAVHAPGPAAIADYARADALAQTCPGSCEDAQAAALLRRAVALSPGYEAAWEQLAQDEFSEQTVAGFTAFRRDNARALAVASTPEERAQDLDNEAFADIVEGQDRAAAPLLVAAHRTDPADDIAILNLAFVRQLTGQPAAAARLLSVVLARAAARGSYYRVQLFAGVRSGEATFERLHRRDPALAAYYRILADAEASLDLYGRPTPGPVTAGRITALSVVPSGGGYLARAQLGWSGLEPTDRVAVRWYLGSTFLPGNSQVDWPVGTAGLTAGGGGLTGPLVTVAPGATYRIEVYVNGRLSRTLTWTAP